MSYFYYKDKQLFIENCSVQSIAEYYGTPCYLYSKAALIKNYQQFGQQIHYAVKANSNLAILNILAKQGAGFDIVSVGELERVVAAGGDTQKIIFSGVGKQDHEIKRALEVNIQCFNIESHAEIDQINRIAQSLDKIAPIAFRINPNISVKTHPYIATGLKENKFGIAHEEAIAFYEYAKTRQHLKIIGIACHLGSQINEVSPYQDALKLLLNLIDELKNKGITIECVDVGGGFAVSYNDETVIDVKDYAQHLMPELKNRNLKLILAPGRAIVGNTSVLLTKVISLKQHFAIVDAGMNDLIRPALYEAEHKVIPVNCRDGKVKSYDVVGPVCETGDFLAKNSPLCIEANDLLAITVAGAYGFAMSSNYNTRPRAVEVMVDHDKHYVIRAREKITDLLLGEQCLP